MKQPRASRNPFDESGWNPLSTLLGKQPPIPARISARLEAIEDAGDHLRQKVVILPGGEDPIPAWLLRPKGPPRRRPAMLCLHSTTHGAGKDVPVGRTGFEPGSPPVESRSYALQLVRRGYVTLTPDLLCDGERVSPGGRPYDTREFYRRHPEQSAAGRIVWDCRRALDFLETLEEVDAGRIGVIGHSHGAHYGLFAAVFDTRIRAAVCNGGVLYWSGKGDPRHWARDPEPPSMVHIPPMRSWYERGGTPCAFWELLTPLASRPVLCMDGEQDGNHPQVRETFEALKKVYARQGHEQALAWFSYPGGHDFPVAAREHAYDWLDRSLFEGEPVKDQASGNIFPSCSWDRGPPEYSPCPELRDMSMRASMA